MGKAPPGKVFFFLLGGRFGIFIFFLSVWGWGKEGDVRAGGRGVGFDWKLEGGGVSEEEGVGGGTRAGSMSAGGGG